MALLVWFPLRTRVGRTLTLPTPSRGESERSEDGAQRVKPIALLQHPSTNHTSILQYQYSAYPCIQHSHSILRSAGVTPSKQASAMALSDTPLFFFEV